MLRRLVSEERLPPMTSLLSEDSLVSTRLSSIPPDGKLKCVFILAFSFR